MSALRWLLSIVIVAAAAWLIQTYSISCYVLNVEKRTIDGSTNAAVAAQIISPLRAHAIARNNVAQLEQLVRRFPWDPDLNVLLATNLRLIGRDDAAVGAFTAALRYQPAPELYLRLAETQFALGRTNDALATLRTATALDPTNGAKARQMIIGPER